MQRVVGAVEHDRPLQGPAALADGVGVDEAGQVAPGALGFEVGPVEAVVEVEDGRGGSEAGRRNKP